MLRSRRCRSRVGALVMLVVTVVAAVPHRPGARAGRAACVFPAVAALTSSTRRHVARWRPAAQQLRAEVSEVAHESFDGALVVKTLGREADGDRAVRRRAPASCATANVARRPGPRPVRPDDGGAAQPRRRSPSCWSAPPGSPTARPTPASLVSHRLPVHPAGASRSARSAGCSPSCRARGRLRPGARAVLEATGETPYGAGRALGRRRRRRGSAVARRRLRLRRHRRRSLPRRHLRRAGRAAPSRVVGPTGSGKSTLAGAARPAGRPGRRARCCSTASTCAGCARAQVSDAGRVRRRSGTFLFDDTVRGNVTLGARRTPTTRSGRRCGPRRPTASSPRCPTGSTPASASAAPRCPAASGSGSRWPAPSSAGRGCWCSTTPPARSTPQVEARDPRRRCAAATRRRPSSSSPTARPPSRWPTRCVSLEHGRVARPRHPRGAAGAPSPGYARAGHAPTSAQATTARRR